MRKLTIWKALERDLRELVVARVVYGWSRERVESGSVRWLIQPRAQVGDLFCRTGEAKAFVKGARAALERPR